VRMYCLSPGGPISSSREGGGCLEEEEEEREGEEEREEGEEEEREEEESWGASVACPFTPPMVHIRPGRPKRWSP